MWIKIDRDLPHKPEVMRLAEILGVDELQVVGHLVLFWSWCDANMSLECPDVKGTKKGLNRAACHEGMVDALIEVGWLQVVQDGAHERYRIPNFERHLSKSAKTRALDQQKKQRKRTCPDAKGTNVPGAEGTKSGLEEIREDKNNINNGRPLESRIPDSLNDAECIAAAESWFSYLDANGLEVKNPKYNEPALQAWWNQMARLGREKYLLGVEQSMAAMRWNVEFREPQQNSGKARKAESKEWMAALKAARAHPNDWEQRQKILTPEVFEALKRTGSKAVAFGTDFELKTLRELFESHLKDITSGITSSN